MKIGTRVKIVSPKSQYNGKLGVITGRTGIGKRRWVLLDENRNRDPVWNIEFFPSELRPTRKAAK